MNAISRIIEQASAFDQGDAPRPHRFSVQDMYAMFVAGVLEEGAREELIEGELIEMPEDGDRHRQLSSDLGFWLCRALSPKDFRVVPSSTLVLSDFNAPSPDWCVSSASVPVAELRGENALLVIEQAHSSVRRDLGWKAALYARHGVRDYWVIDVEKREVHVHRDPTADGYGFKQRFKADDSVAALLVPELTLRLDDFGQG